MSTTTMADDTSSRLLYVIHAADDYALAAFVKNEIETRIAGWRVFVASKAGDIPTGSDWLREIHQNLKEAAAYLLLLTPQSINRRWVWYEAGAAWMSDRVRLPVVAAGLTREQIEFPLKIVQTLMLDKSDEAEQLFKDLGGLLDSPDSFCATVRTLASLSKPTVPEARLQEVREALGRLRSPQEARREG